MQCHRRVLLICVPTHRCLLRGGRNLCFLCAFPITQSGSWDRKACLYTRTHLIRAAYSSAVFAMSYPLIDERWWYVGCTWCAYLPSWVKSGGTSAGLTLFSRIWSRAFSWERAMSKQIVPASIPPLTSVLSLVWEFPSPRPCWPAGWGFNPGWDLHQQEVGSNWLAD